MYKTIKIGRDSGTSQFIPVKGPVSKPATTTVETIKKGKWAPQGLSSFVALGQRA